MRIPGGKVILDNTGIHPESYDTAKEILAIAGISLAELGKEQMEENKAKLAQLRPAELSAKLSVGKETITDILKALMQPGRDMRDEMPAPLLRKDVLSMEDLKPGMELKGTVRNVIDFGAFVDIGVKQDGLVHLSKLSRSFVKHPKDVVSVGDVVTVWIEQVDVKRPYQFNHGRSGKCKMTQQELQHLVEELSLSVFNKPFTHRAVFNSRLKQPVAATI